MVFRTQSKHFQDQTSRVSEENDPMHSSCKVIFNHADIQRRTTESNNKTFLDSHSQDTRWIYSTGELSPCDKNTDDTVYKD